MGASEFKLHSAFFHRDFKIFAQPRRLTQADPKKMCVAVRNTAAARPRIDRAFNTEIE